MKNNGAPNPASISAELLSTYRLNLCFYSSWIPSAHSLFSFLLCWWVIKPLRTVFAYSELLPSSGHGNLVLKASVHGSCSCSHKHSSGYYIIITYLCYHVTACYVQQLNAYIRRAIQHLTHCMGVGLGKVTQCLWSLIFLALFVELHPQVRPCGSWKPFSQTDAHKTKLCFFFGWNTHNVCAERVHGVMSPVVANSALTILNT